MNDTRAIEDVLATVPYGACPLDGVATAGQPDPSVWRELARAGVRTVLDLRAPEEPRGYDEAAAVRRAGLEYIVLPVNQATLSDLEFDRARDIVRDPARRPIFVHCATSNRVGGLLLPYFALDEGMSIPDATRMAQRAGLRSAELASTAIDYVRRHASH